MFAAQVAGGVNYFPPTGSNRSVLGDPNNPDWDDPMSWCTGVRCIEDNFSAGEGALIPGTPVVKQASRTSIDPKNPTPPLPPLAPLAPFNAQVARIASTLHDVLDGRAVLPASDAPGNGAVWLFDGLRFRAPATTLAAATPANFINVLGSLNDTPPPENMSAGVIHEENISIPGSALSSVVSEWLRREPPLAKLNQETFLLGLTQVMVDAGSAEDEICRLYTLHQPGDACPPWGPPNHENAPLPPLNLCADGTELIGGVCETVGGQCRTVGQTCGIGPPCCSLLACQGNVCLVSVP
jgi:hypothetical protein